MHRLVFRPYIEDYWQHMAAECRFAFTSPDLVLGGLNEALNSPEEHRVERIFVQQLADSEIRGLVEIVNRLRTRIA